MTAAARLCLVGIVLFFSGASLRAGAIYALNTTLGPTGQAESASASVLLTQDVTSTLTLSFTYQLQSRFASVGALYVGSPTSAPVSSVGGLPLLSALAFSSTRIVDDSLVTALINQAVFIQLNTSAGSLSGSGQLVLSQRQGGGPPLPPFDTPEPGTTSLCGAALTCFAVFACIQGTRRRRESANGRFC